MLTIAKRGKLLGTNFIGRCKMENTDKDLMKPSELALKLGVSPTTIYRLLSKHLIGFYKINGKIYISDCHLSAFLDHCEVKPS